MLAKKLNVRFGLRLVLILVLLEVNKTIVIVQMWSGARLLFTALELIAF